MQDGIGNYSNASTEIEALQQQGLHFQKQGAHGSAVAVYQRLLALGQDARPSATTSAPPYSSFKIQPKRSNNSKPESSSVHRNPAYASGLPMPINSSETPRPPRMPSSKNSTSVPIPFRLPSILAGYWRNKTACLKPSSSIAKPCITSPAILYCAGTTDWPV